MQIITKKSPERSDFLIYIGDIRAADAFPGAIVEKRDIDQETAIPEHIGHFVGIAVHFTAGTMIDIPIAGTALQCHIAKGEIIEFFAVDAAYQFSVFVRQIPCFSSSDAVIAVIQQVDLIAVKNGTVVAIDIDPIPGSLHIAAVPEILVIIRTQNGFAACDLMSRIFEPQMILVGHHILRRH